MSTFGFYRVTNDKNDKLLMISTLGREYLYHYKLVSVETQSTLHLNISNIVCTNVKLFYKLKKRLALNLLSDVNKYFLTQNTV